MFTYGGFPEPLFKQSSRSLRRWHNEKLERLFREDVQDLSNVRDISSMKLLSDLLVDRVGSLLSTNALREDLEISHRAASNWIHILESLYYHFRIYPFTQKKIRSLKKEPKLYLWDWSEIGNEAARFENLVASHLLKLVHFLSDWEGYKADLFFLRDVTKKEIDFLVTIDKKPWFSVEVKLSDTHPSQEHYYFKRKLNIPFNYHVVKTSRVDKQIGQVRVISADKFLSGLI